jgi:hypothetical protein
VRSAARRAGPAPALRAHRFGADMSSTTALRQPFLGPPEWHADRARGLTLVLAQTWRHGHVRTVISWVQGRRGAGSPRSGLHRPPCEGAGGGGPTGVSTESDGPQVLGRGTAYASCLRSRPPSDIRLLDPARASSRPRAGPCDGVRADRSHPLCRGTGRRPALRHDRAAGASSHRVARQRPPIAREVAEYGHDTAATARAQRLRGGSLRPRPPAREHTGISPFSDACICNVRHPIIPLPRTSGRARQCP